MSIVKLDKIGVVNHSIHQGYGYSLQAGDYVSIPSLLGTETITSFGGTASISLSAGKINIDSTGILFDIYLSNGSIYFCNEHSGNICFDSSLNKYHGKIVSSTLSHIQAIDDYSVALDTYGYSTKVYADFIDIIFNGTSAKIIYFILNKDNDVVFANDLAYISEQEIEIDSDTSLGVISSIKDLVFTDSEIEFYIENISDWEIIRSIYLSGTDIKGNIGNVSFDLTKDLIINGLNNLTGNIDWISGLSLTGEVNIANTGVTVNTQSFTNSSYIEKINLENTNSTGNIDNFKNLTSLVSLNIKNTGISGSINELTKLRIEDDLVLTGSNIEGDISGLSGCVPSGEVDLSWLSIEGNISDIKHWEAFTIDLRGTNLDTCSPCTTLFPNCTDLDLSNCQFDRASVDNILIAKDNDDTVNGILDLSNNDEILASGYIALKNLESKGWSVSVEQPDNIIFNVTVSSPITDAKFLIYGTDFLFNDTVRYSDSDYFYEDISGNLIINLFEPEKLTKFYSINNDVSGTCPDITKIFNLEELLIINNSFSGTMPDIAPLTKLTKLDCKDNNFNNLNWTGVSNNLTYLDLSGNNLNDANINIIVNLLDDANIENGYLNLVGDNMGIPTGDGVTACYSLANKGWTLLLNNFMPFIICDDIILEDSWELEDDLQVGGC